MPQMNPIFWTYLMISFILVVLFTNSINYFFYLPNNNPMKSLSVTHPSTLWKW